MQPSPTDHDDDGSSPGQTHASGAGAGSKPQRVLACLLCQQRKVKCDRRFPCANCTRSGAQCVPATLLPRQRRRRFPERELLDRLRHYEQLLRDHNIDFEPLHKPNPPLGKDLAGLTGQDQSHHDEHSTQAQSPNSSDKPETDYRAKDIWDAMGHPAVDHDSDDSETAIEAAGVRKLWDRIYSQTDHMLFGTRVEPVDLSPLHPGPAEIFRLWQTYMDNVNPLLAVTHTPSLQTRIIEAAGHVASIDPVTEALMFSIYAMAIISLTPQECVTYFVASKQDLLLRYHFGCQQALMNCGILKTTSRDALTAYYLYLVSLAGTTHPQTIYSLLAIAIRLAKRLGMDNEASLAKETPFEAEMRRKLWWSLVLFDSRAAEKTDNKNSQLNPSWDCRIPLNLSDTDLRPESKELQPVRGRSTEAVFSVIRAELGDYLRHASYHLDFSAASLRPIARPSSLDLEGLQRHLEERYLQYFDQTNPLHHLAKWTAYSYIARFGLWRQFAAFADPNGKRPSASDWDAAIVHAIGMLEADKQLMTSPLTKRYHWFLGFYFPLPAFLIIAKSLRVRPLSPHASRAWEAMSDNFAVRLQTVFRQEVAPFMKLFNPLFPAWDACVKAHANANIGTTSQMPLPAPPRILGYIREIRASDPTYHSNNSGSTTSNTSTSSPAFYTETEVSSLNDDEMILTPDLFNPTLSMPIMHSWFGGGVGLFDEFNGGGGGGGSDEIMGMSWSSPTPPSANIAASSTTPSTAGRTGTSATTAAGSLSPPQPQVSATASPPMGGPMANWFAPLPAASSSMASMMPGPGPGRGQHNVVVPDHKALETLNLDNIDWDSLGAAPAGGGGGGGGGR
ncbi:uncharacterized protein B0I36DRAFT_299089 [Microdochium trichocladiopsis]|uniref:Zn(2)-C6 fungal-type domain-containing protein n=1 Tax=Microdochium trichocladiopsis TaxID=1682393 RepID=A0A9P8XRQ9_9PEZI|nr:uncharacterized protein B0I36DRAFT_299089 [Microdochium trichocladiopsis]KAH7014198.1 hypothetical protein B0I36DRAFT_299089 [Microdochium trichocladiopsis]